MTRRSEWDYDVFSLNFLLRGFKMHQAGYQMLGSPILEVSECPIALEESLCVKLTGCNCHKQKDEDGNPIPMHVVLSISSAISLYEDKNYSKRCPKCRGYLTRFVCLPERSKQEVKDPFEFSKLSLSDISKSDFELLMERSSKMSQGYIFSAMKNLSPQSNDALSALAQFSRNFISSEERDAADPALAFLPRGGDVAAAPALASQAIGGGVAGDPALASIAIGGGVAGDPALASQARGGGVAAAPALAFLPRGGGGVAAAPARRNLSPSYYYRRGS
jgi:hypothetical protein